MARDSKKPTVKQIKNLVEAQTGMIEEQTQMLRVCFHEIDKLNMVVIRLLDSQGMLHKQECPKCAFKIHTPLLEDIELPTHCPACQEQLPNNEEE
jgi:predicted Zn-ribbon and HTH transcriptional regulator